MPDVLKLVWHYTTTSRLQQILSDGFIRPAAAVLQGGDKPVVWFSSNSVWEESANKSTRNSVGEIVLGNKESTRHFGGGLARIACNAELVPFSWKEFKKQSGVKSKIADAIYAAAIAHGARPSEWFATFEPVPAEKWIAIEIDNGIGWMPYEKR